MVPFIGRDVELAKLKELTRLQTASLVVIKGRRRVGKSRLERIDPATTADANIHRIAARHPEPRQHLCRRGNRWRILRSRGLIRFHGIVGKSTDPQVQAVLDEGIQRVTATGKAAGVLTTDRTLAQKHLSLGALFVAVGVDTSILVRAAQTLAAAYKQDTRA